MANPQTSNGNLSNGAFILSRSLFECDLWYKPPEYIKIWIFLIGKANHTGRTYRGYYCERGQYFCDYKELEEQLDYKIGYRKKKGHEVLMKRLMKVLRDTLRITTTKKPRGILITILNYDTYQNMESYERTNEDTTRVPTKEPLPNQRGLSINKNSKELKNTYSDFFEKSFWSLYPLKNGKKIGKPECYRLYSKFKQSDLEILPIALENYLHSNRVKEGFVKDPERFLKKDFWRDYLTPETNSVVKRFDEQGH